MRNRRTDGISSVDQLNSRFLKLAKMLNEELGFNDQRLSFEQVPHRGGTITWRLRNRNVTKNDGSLSRPPCKLAVTDDDAAEIHVAYNEQWVSAGKRAGYRFKSSNIRFIIESCELQAPLQFRLEWAGREEGSSGMLEFPGKEAAHPHWQFDADASWVGDENAEHPVDVEIPQPEEIVDIECNAATERLPAAQPRNPLFWFHRLHLPARAMWHDRLRSIPGDPEGQQHEPGNTGEIDNWVISAVRYLKHEFLNYT